MYRLTRLQPLYLTLGLMAALLAAFVHNHRLWQRAWFDWQTYWQVAAPSRWGWATIGWCWRRSRSRAWTKFRR